MQESGCHRSWFHKGFIVNAGFLVILIVGVIVGEVFFPLEGVRGRGVPLMNDSMCNASEAGKSVKLFLVRLVQCQCSEG